MIQSAILIPRSDLTLRVVDLPSSLQIAGLLFTALVCGFRSALIACIAYLTIGIFFMPVFHGGGSTGYLMTPDFGYLLGFIPATWICSNLSSPKKKSIYSLTLIAFIGLVTIHFTGIIYILIGTITTLFSLDLVKTVYLYSLSPLPFQIILCPAIALLAKIFRALLII